MTEHHDGFDRSLGERLRAYEGHVPGASAPDLNSISENCLIDFHILEVGEKQIDLRIALEENACIPRQLIETNRINAADS